MTEQFFEFWRPKLRKYVAGRISRFADDSEIDDIVQDTMIRLWEMGEKFDPDHPGVEGLVFRVASGKVNTFLKSRESRNGLGATNCNVLQDDYLTWDSERDTSLDKLVPMIDQLSPRLRDVMRLKLQGKTNEQIANELGFSVHAVDSRSRRAMAKLRELSILALVCLTCIL